MSIAPYDGSPRRIERFRSLQAGQYWRALRDIPREGIAAGLVLLIQSIRWADGEMHTVILRPHPSLIGKTFLREEGEGGHASKRKVTYAEHRFLVAEFEDLFEYEPDARKVRDAELREVQGRIDTLQRELVQGQSDPSVMEEVVASALRADAQAAAAPGAPALAAPSGTGTALAGTDEGQVDVVALSSGGLARALSPGLTEAGVERMRDAARREHRIATIRAGWIQDRTQAITQTIQAMTPFYEEQAAAALATTEEVRDHVAKLMKGIESLDLYVGKDVAVQAIREGAHAPRSEPLTFVQRKLFMDEELAVFDDVDATFDFADSDRFFQALRTHDALVAQIFPTERCVLVMASTRNQVRYANPYESAVRNDENRKVFLLVRDGMNIHRVHSPVESHLGADLLFPTRSQQDGIFRGVDGSKIRFEDVAFTDSLRSHEAFALHFKRFLILACGLDHRLGLFGEFYEGPPSMSFVSQDFQDEHCRFLHDGDAGRQLPGPARPTAEEWVEGRNAFLRSGSRVLCNWFELMNPRTAPGACRASETLRDGFDFPFKPAERTGVAIAYRSGTSTCVDVEVSGQGRGGPRRFNAKVDITLLGQGGWGWEDTPYLCLDAVEPEDLEWYIHNRAERRNHIAYIRFFKRALAFLRAERLAEAEARSRLFQALEDGRVGTPDTRPALVSQAVVAWRAANRGADLPRFEGGTSKAWRELLDQMFALAGGDARAEAIEAFARGLGCEPLRLVMDGKGRYQLYATPADAECDDRLEPHAWVHLVTLRALADGYAESSRKWAVLTGNVASETTLHEWAGASAWADRPSAFRSPSEKARLLDATANARVRLSAIVGPPDAERFLALRADLVRVRRQVNARASFVQNPNVAVPVGAILTTDGQLRLLHVSAPAHRVLRDLAPDTASLDLARRDYANAYQDSEGAARTFDAIPRDQIPWSLGISEVPPGTALDGPLALEAARASMSRIERSAYYDPRIDTWFADWRKGAKGVGVWLAPDLAGPDGGLAVDAVLGIRLPDDYAPTKVEAIHLHAASGKKAPRFPRFVEITAYDANAAKGGWRSDRFKDMGPENEHGGVGSSTNVVPSLEAARRYALSQAKDGMRAVRAEDIVGAPQPPEGVERWYIVPIA
jgi:hypothetical protein